MALKVQQVEPLQVLPRYLLGISTKMYFSHAQTMEYVSELATVDVPQDIRLFFLPSFISIHSCAAYLKSRNASPSILLGGQDCTAGESGAQTGSISPEQLREVGCSLVELGHAERRRPPISEDDAWITSKVMNAIRAGLIPLVCIGEPAQKGDSISSRVGFAADYVSKQVMHVWRELVNLREVAHASTRHIVFAYEPVWAIGAEKPADAEYVVAVVRAIKQAIQGKMTTEGLDIRFIYGGSAGPGTWNALKSELDGLFLGRFAHDINNVREVVQEMLS